MEGKKTIIAIIVVVILIISFVVITYLYSNFSKTQIGLLTEESNKIVEMDLKIDDIDFKIKTEKDYAVVEKAIKEYTSDLKNIYVEMEEMSAGINPNSIFSAQNIEDDNLDKIDEIISEYKVKSEECISEFEALRKENKIVENIETRDIKGRKNYYKDLYNTIILGEGMQSQFDILEEELKNQKAELNSKLNKIEKIKEFLEDNESSWEIKDDKIQFTNLIKMTEYYNLLNQLIG